MVVRTRSPTRERGLPVFERTAARSQDSADTEVTMMAMPLQIR
jgi:hypothetical protein